RNTDRHRPDSAQYYRLADFGHLLQQNLDALRKAFSRSEDSDARRGRKPTPIHLCRPLPARYTRERPDTPQPRNAAGNVQRSRDLQREQLTGRRSYTAKATNGRRLRQRLSWQLSLPWMPSGDAWSLAAWREPRQ